LISKIWVNSINFIPEGSYLNIKAKVVYPQPVANAQITIGVQIGYYVVNATKLADTNGEVTFRLYPAIAGTTYVTAVTESVLDGYTWDSTNGVNSVRYTLQAN
jgi:hypothetical protein